MSEQKKKKERLRVQIRGGYSDRNGITPLNTTMQLTEFDTRTKTAILNCLSEIQNSLILCVSSNPINHNWTDFYLDIAKNAYCLEVDSTFNYDLNKLRGEIHGFIRETIIEGTYDETLSLIEYMLNWTTKNFKSRTKRINYGVFSPDTPTSGHYQQYDYNEKDVINQVFEKEYVGYRFIGDCVTPITDSIEVKEIEESLATQFQGTKSHIQKALGFLSDRDHPDYKNSIKESICAVESICKVIVGNDGASLGEALKILESKHGLKGQLKSGFEKLYAFTNGNGGIRHAEGLFESDVTFEEAKYMLVSCCAFVNYLIAEYGKTKN